MKLAWIVWRYNDIDTPEIWFTEPDRLCHFLKVVPIVYAEIMT